MASSDHLGKSLDVVLSQVRTGLRNEAKLNSGLISAIRRVIPVTEAAICRQYSALHLNSKNRDLIITAQDEFKQESCQYDNGHGNDSINRAHSQSLLNIGATSGGMSISFPLQHNDGGPSITIHVCDEGKKSKKDFECPRNLLVREMKYFAAYLTPTADDGYDDVDISVHCDINIFDWLIKYVKRKYLIDEPSPVLDVTNVISILISSDFLAMENLVKECVQYCHSHMAEILAIPCNMNCISDKLTSQIADTFNHNEIEDLKDRKDKFRSKLFIKKIGQWFQLSSSAEDSLMSLFQCVHCKRMLTGNTAAKINCTSSRLVLDKKGEIRYFHEANPNFDVTEYLIKLKHSVKSWREVYWRLWGLSKTFFCLRCLQWFPFYQLCECSYHPEPAVFQETDDASSANILPTGTYSCCGSNTLRFQHVNLKKGCRNKEHVINIDDLTETQKSCYTDLITHKSAVCGGSDNSLQAKLNERESFDIFEMDKAIGKLSALSSRQNRDQPSFFISSFEANDRKWDTEKPIRWNQDNQREDDGRRFEHLSQMMRLLRNDVQSSKQPTDVAGGIFAKLETQLRRNGHLVGRAVPKTRQK